MPNPSAILSSLTNGSNPSAQGPQPFGSTQSLSPVLQSYQQWSTGRQMGPGLPRPMQDFLEGAFGPLSPLVPMPIDRPNEESGRAEPRRLQYPVGWNLPVGQPGSEGYKLAPFAVLRNAADRYSYARAMINIRKDEIVGTEWDIGATADVASKVKGDKGAGKDIDERSRKLVKWFKRPDPEYYSFASWVSSLLEERFVCDNTSIYLHPTRSARGGLFDSDVAALELINGDTIRPLFNIRGGTPTPPEPAYQQYLWGVPRSDLSAVLAGRDLEELEEKLEADGYDMGDPLSEYRGDQLWYLPRYKRTWTPYGFPEVEQGLIPILLGMNRQSFLLDFYSEGTIPGVYVVAGDAYVTPAQQRQLQDSLNTLAGDVAWKHRVIVLPPGSKTDPQKDMTWAKEADQVVAEMMMMILHIQPHEVGMVPGGRSSGLGGKGMAEEQAHAVSAQRTIPELMWLKQNLLDPAIQRLFGQSDLEWKWLGFEEDTDEQSEAATEAQFISIGKITIDEARIEDGKDPFNLPLTSTPVIIAGGVVTPLDPTVKAPPPPPAPAAAIGGPNANDPTGTALAQAGLPTKPDSNKPKVNPLANLTHEKKGKRKAARQELVDRFNSNLKDQSEQIAEAQKEREKNMPGKGKDGKKDKVTVASLVKWRIKYNGAKLDGDDGVVINYLRRSYPPDEVDWAAKADWTYEPHVLLSDIDYQHRPGGRDPRKVEAIGASLKTGASLDPVVLVRADDGRLRVADGYHRCLGAVHAGLEDVPAFIGTGVDSKLPQIEGSMQAASDSVKKAAVSELAVLRRFLRNGNKVENFRTAAIDSDVMRLLPDKINKIGTGPAMDWARDFVGKAGGNPQALRDYYNEGADGRIDWGSDGDFMQCVNIASDHMDEDDAKGFCNLRHQDATGGAPGTEKNISLSAPLATGLAPFDQGVKPKDEDEELKYSDAEARDAGGRWAAGSAEGDDVGTAPHYVERDGGRTAHLDPVRRTADGRTVAVHGIGPDQRSHDVRRGAFGEYELKEDDADVVKYDPSEARDDAGRWTADGSGGVEHVTDEFGANHPGREAILALERGDHPNVRPNQVDSIMKYANHHAFEAPVRLEDIRVNGTRQFGQDGLGIKRADMPQIPIERRGEFFSWLNENYKTREVSGRTDPQTLQPSQSEISVERVAKMYADMAKNGTGDTTVLVSKDNYIIDGHHHWGAATALSFDQPGLTIGTIQIGMKAQPLLDAARAWDKEVGIASIALVARPDVTKVLSAIDAELQRRGINPLSL